MAVLLATSARGEERFALVISAGFGWLNDRPLSQAEADAERVREVLVERGSFAADRVEVLREPDAPTVRARLRRLAEVLPSLESDSLVLLYFLGHADSLGLHLRGSRLTYSELREALRGLPATHRVGILDTRNTRLPLVPGAPMFALSVAAMHPPDSEGFALLVASGADELSLGQRSGGAVFTEHLVAGLWGEADATADGRVTLDEACLHAVSRAAPRVSISGRVYQTSCPALGTSGELALTERRASEPPSREQGTPEPPHVPRLRELMRRVAAGEAPGVLPQVDGLLAQHPKEPRALQLRARVLVRLAEVHEQARRTREMFRALREALLAEPSLAEDPDFTHWLERLRELEAAELRERELAELSISRHNPRAAYRWGVGMDAVGSRGWPALTGSLVLGEAWFPYVTLAPLEPAGDVGMRLVPLGWRWSPLVGLGVHVPWARLWHGPRAGPPPEDPDWFDPDAPEIIQRELDDGHVHLDLGVQYFGEGSPAFACELGLGIQLFLRPSIESFGLRPTVNVGCGLYFR